MGPKWGLGSCPVRRGALQWMTTGLASLLPFQSVTPRSHGRGSPGWRGGYPWCLPGCRDSYRLWSHPKSWVDLDRSQSSMLFKFTDESSWGRREKVPGSRLHSDLIGLIQRRGSCIICHPQLFVLFCFMAISAIESSATLSDHRHIKSLVCRAAIFYPFPNILWKLTKLGVFLNSYHGYNEQSRK